MVRIEWTVGVFAVVSGLLLQYILWHDNAYVPGGILLALTGGMLCAIAWHDGHLTRFSPGVEGFITVLRRTLLFLDLMLAALTVPTILAFWP